MAYLLAGKYDTAVALLRERIRLIPETDFSRVLLASALGHLDEVDDAHRIWQVWDTSKGYSAQGAYFERGNQTVKLESLNSTKRVCSIATIHWLAKSSPTISQATSCSTSSRMTTFRHPDSGSVTIAHDGSSGSDAM